jgi:uncharacterized protein (UPF0276 family)
MPTNDFWAAAAPLFQTGKVEVLEWSFDMAWSGEAIPFWCRELLLEYSDKNLLLGHGVTFSLLSARSTARQQLWLEKLLHECQLRSYVQISEHFGFAEAGPLSEGAPFPVPLTGGFLRIGKQKLSQLKETSQLPVGLENLAFAFCKQDVLDQGTFLDELLDEIDGFLILDLHNIYCQSANFNIDPADILCSYPLERVVEIHISGGSWSHSLSGNRKAVVRDTHDGRVPSEVFELVSTVLHQCTNLRYVVMERIGGSLFDVCEQSAFRADYDRLSELVKVNRFDDSIIKKRTIKSVFTDDQEDLTEFQDNLIALLSRDLEPAEMIKAITNGNKFMFFDSYVKEFDIDMVVTASGLVKRWGKPALKTMF